MPAPPAPQPDGPQSAEAETQPQERSVEKPAHAAVQQQRLLVVDDSTSICLLYRTILEAAGYAVLTATTGQRGLELAMETQPALLLVDLVLPDMDGLAMLRALRLAEQAQEHLPVPALLLTALDAPASVLGDQAALGVRLLLDKAHLRPPDLVRAVRLALSSLR